MNITEHEMRGLLTGKCLPGDMRLNEELPAYLVRKFAELKAQRDALAAENAAMNQVFSTKEFTTEVTDAFSDTAVLRIDGDEHHSWQWVDNDSAVICAVLNAMKPETPATDAWLNSVRATAFDDLYAAFVNHSERAGLSEDASVTLRQCNDAVLHCCDQLRAGKDG